MGRIVFFLAEALRALRRSAAPSIAAIVTIVATTVLLGVLVPVLRASESKTEEVRSQIELRVFLSDVARGAEVKKLKSEIQATPHVAGTEYVSKAEARAILEKRVSGDLKDSLQELNHNPLPASFNVELDDADNLEAVSSALQPPNRSGEPTPISPIIDDVEDSRQEAEEIRDVTFGVKIVLLVITAVLLVASLMLVANTIRLSIYARRREVEVMRLVGGTNWFIRWPFIIEGTLVGLMGAAIAIAILWIGKVVVVDPLKDKFNLVANLDTMEFVPLVIILVGAAMAVSALGSGLTLRRFLRV